MYKMTIDCHHRNERQNSRTSWFSVLEIRIKNWSAVLLKMDMFRQLIAVPIQNVQEIWPTKMDFGQPNADNGREMANG